MRELADSRTCRRVRSLGWTWGCTSPENDAVRQRGSRSGWRALHRSRRDQRAGRCGVRLGDGPKSARAKLFESIWNLPSAHTETEQAYDRLLQIIDHYLDIARSERRQLDTWERIDLNDALSWLERSQVPFASRAYPPRDYASRQPVARYPTSKDQRCSRFRLRFRITFADCVSALRARRLSIRTRPERRGSHSCGSSPTRRHISTSSRRRSGPTTRYHMGACGERQDAATFNLTSAKEPVAPCVDPRLRGDDG